jgi:hypothetical protein
MFRFDYLLVGIASLLLMAVNWLAFHDFLEAHTTRDWLMLFASVLVFIHFARVLRRLHPRRVAGRGQPWHGRE